MPPRVLKNQVSKESRQAEIAKIENIDMSFVFNDDITAYQDESLFPKALGQGIGGDDAQNVDDYVRSIQNSMANL